jgi:hypothetical protein
MYRAYSRASGDLLSIQNLANMQLSEQSMRQLLSAFRAEAVIERIKTNNVLNRLLWLCAIIYAPTIAAAYYSTDGAQIFFCGLAITPVAAILLSYFIWMFRSPDRLQSEEYLLARQRILQGSKDQNTFPTISQASDHPPRQITSAEALAPDDPSALSHDGGPHQRKLGDD